MCIHKVTMLERLTLPWHGSETWHMCLVIFAPRVGIHGMLTSDSVEQFDVTKLYGFGISADVWNMPAFSTLIICLLAQITKEFCHKFIPQSLGLIYDIGFTLHSISIGCCLWQGETKIHNVLLIVPKCYCKYYYTVIWTWHFGHNDVTLWSILLQGTNIAAGKCRGIVFGTGTNTEIGEFSLCAWQASSGHVNVRFLSALPDQTITTPQYVVFCGDCIPMDMERPAQRYPFGRGFQSSILSSLW